jgi:hypothetical protein
MMQQAADNPPYGLRSVDSQTPSSGSASSREMVINPPSRTLSLTPSSPPKI